jgi:microcompartment protein CcmL/EutN
MCKTARVRLVRYEVITDAFVTIVIRGPLADVESAVGAGAAAAGRVGELLGQHVIPRPDGQLEEPMGGPAASGGTPSP